MEMTLENHAPFLSGKFSSSIIQFLLKLKFRTYNSTTSIETCHNQTESSPYCITQQSDELPEEEHRWGYCPAECGGEKAEPDSKYNLAHAQYSQVWEQSMYDLGSYGAGYCYTYNPPTTSGFAFRNRLFLLLGDKRYPQVMSQDLRGFVIYLHEKGQFWPRPGLEDSIGQSKGIKLERLNELIGQFEFAKFDVLNRDEYCTEAENYSFTDCIHAYIERETSCKINWNKISEEDSCSENIDLKKYQTFLKFIKYSSFRNLSRVTGCRPKCRWTLYRFIEEEKNDIKWNPKWVSSIYLLPKSSGFKHVVENYELSLIHI